MSYANLLSIANILDTKMRLSKYMLYYRDKTIDGLHYVNFLPSSNTISISLPNHATHHESTSYLLFKKSSTSINTTRSQSTDIKKFLDYLSVWEINLLDGDLFVIVLGFIDYLRCIKPSKGLFNKAVLSATMKTLPLVDEITAINYIPEIGYNKEGFMARINKDELSYTSIKKSVSSAIQYISFLQERTNSYRALKLSQLPKRVKYRNTLLSGTLGMQVTTIIDIEGILASAGLFPDKAKYSQLLSQKVFTIDQIDIFLNSIPPQHYQNKLLFYMLKFFGLRDGEAANLMIDTSTIPSNLLQMEYFKAKECIKNNLKGDIEYSKHIDRWVCYVVERDNQDYRSQHKSGSREIPLLFPQDLFLDLLVNALKEREVLLMYTKKKHDFLFVSRDNKNKGNPINGKTIGSRYSFYAKKILDKSGIDLTQFSPHSFRHFFATYLIRVKKEDISDVSRWLGHSSIVITRTTYSHYIPREDKDEDKVIKIQASLETKGNNDEHFMD